ncbi:MAG: hypothetical protein JKY56_23620 [Kofleriaceae bacterium]|nr:hypothetical protein [Kofleriaceae bacterium]
MTELPNLKVRWLIDGEEVGMGQSLSLDPSLVAPGAKTLQVQVAHTTELVRSDPSGKLIHDIEWDLGDGAKEPEDVAQDQAGCGCQQSPNRSTGLATGLLLLPLIITWRKGKSRRDIR